MTHRARRITQVVTMLVLVAFLLNVLVNRHRQHTTNAAANAAPPPAAVAPLYVPRPAELLAGHGFSEYRDQIVAAQDLAMAFLTYSPGRQSRGQYVETVLA